MRKRWSTASASEVAPSMTKKRPSMALSILPCPNKEEALSRQIQSTPPNFHPHKIWRGSAGLRPPAGKLLPSMAKKYNSSASSLHQPFPKPNPMTWRAEQAPVHCDSINGVQPLWKRPCSIPSASRAARAESSFMARWWPASNCSRDIDKEGVCVEFDKTGEDAYHPHAWLQECLYALKRHLAKVANFLWLGEDGMKVLARGDRWLCL
ncbi:hypothetical protein ZWY2020_002297 [Hordeum vulgare]|nr:hypothetical protein ZWY2020_002297 [Hordeum vulgare]